MSWITVSSGWSPAARSGLLQGALAAHGLRRVIGLTTPHFMAALAVVSQSDMAAPLPRRLAAAFAEQYRLKLFDPPYPSPPFDIMALWHRDHGAEPRRSPGCGAYCARSPPACDCIGTQQKARGYRGGPAMVEVFAVKT